MADCGLLVSKAPATYKEWLDCFEVLKKFRNIEKEQLERIMEGSFCSSPQMTAIFQKQLIETVNAMLDMRIKHFVRSVNECIEFNEFEFLDLCFVKLKKETAQVLRLAELRFLDSGFRESLSSSIREQLGSFTDKVLGHLGEEASEHGNTALEDALYLIKRIDLF